MIQKNVDKLKNTDWRALTASLRMRMRKGEVIWDMNMMINKKTGEILEVSHSVTRYDDLVVLPIALKEVKNSFFKIEPMGLEESLPGSIRDTVSQSIEQYNK